jgi:hypothetical protein
MLQPNRIVALLTPLVFAPLAGVAATWAAENLPGVTVPRESIEEIFIAGALIALAPAAQWLHGWQKWEQGKQAADLAAATGFGVQPVPPPLEESPPEEIDVAEDDFPELEGLDEVDDLDDFDEFEDTSVSEDEQPVTAGS